MHYATEMSSAALLGWRFPFIVISLVLSWHMLHNLSFHILNKQQAVGTTGWQSSLLMLITAKTDVWGVSSCGCLNWTIQATLFMTLHTKMSSIIFHWERMMTTKYYIVHMACSHTMSTKNMKRCSFGFILELPWNSCIGLWKGKENEGSCMSQGEDVWLEKNGRHFRETAFIIKGI